MRSLSDRPESNSDGIFDSEDELVEEPIGWEDDPDTELDVYLKNKKLDAKLIKLANDKTALGPIFQRYQIDFKQQYSPSGWTHKSLCPFKDHHERTPSFSYNPQENRFNCFGCQRGGKAVQFIAYMDDKPQIQVAKELLNRVLREDEIIAEIGEHEEDNFKIRDLLFEYADYVANFVERNNYEANAIQYAETVTWPLDAYVRNHLPAGSIVLEQLEGRIALLKEHLDAYGEDE